MKGKFDKYWDCYSVVLACAIVLDPRYKLDYVDFNFKKIHPIEDIAEMKVESIQTILYKFFSEYECPKPMATTNVSSCVESFGHTSGDMDDPDDDEDMEDDVSELHFVWYMLCYVFNNKDCNVVWYYFSLQIFLIIRNLSIIKVVVVPKKKKTQLDLYLEEPRLSKKKNSKLEVLSWWKENYNRFPMLSLMAQDLMSIPITTVASKSSFSIGKKNSYYVSIMSFT